MLAWIAPQRGRITAGLKATVAAEGTEDITSYHSHTALAAYCQMRHADYPGFADHSDISPPAVSHFVAELFEKPFYFCFGGAFDRRRRGPQSATISMSRQDHAALPHFPNIRAGTVFFDLNLEFNMSVIGA